ncbi:tetratricopeptide repeat protein [Algicella marina]|uniref:Tetratricopeptide repeat protein n=1 Tax=Algicella marina TaxID=2683284 RepID=A0A6P1T516_9RHOB|nr:tetratricopeptide repeat protein [Algicella marina]QHQ36810.1 hypothetical protein GO499_17300 [Algicella marina]
MRLVLWLFAWLTFLFSTVAHAQDTMLVRSAEHPEYSRLLVTVPSGSSWALVREGRTATVSFPGIRAGFALGAIFDRMPRTRIVAVEGRDAVLGSALDITLACSCDVEISRLGNRFIAIDVRRAAKETAAPSTRRLLSGNAGTKVSEAATEPLEKEDPSARPAQMAAEPADSSMERPDTTSAPAKDELVPARPSGRSDDQDMAEPITDSPQIAALEAARESLVTQLNRAAEEGLLDLADPPAPEFFVPTTPNVTTREEAHADLEMMPANQDGSPISDQDLPQVKAEPSEREKQKSALAPPGPGHAKAEKVATEPAESSAKRNPQPEMVPTPPTGSAGAPVNPDDQMEIRTPIQDVAEENRQRAAARACPNDAVLDVRSWQAETAVSEEIGRLRRLMVSDYGTLDAAVVRDLARFYISLGFGREAEYVTRLLPSPSAEEADLLMEIARIIEGRPHTDDGVLAKGADCHGRFTLWRAVAGLEHLEPGEDRTEAIIGAFAELPAGLRRLAGAEIIRHALANDGAEHAELITRILDRTPGEQSASEKVVRAQVTAELGQAAKAVANLDLSPTEAGAEAERLNVMMLRARSHIESGNTVSEELIADFESLRRQYRGTASATDIDLTLARLEFLSRHPDRGFKRLRAIVDANPDQAEELRQIGRDGLHFLDEEMMRPSEYLSLVLANADMLDGGAESLALRNALVRKLMDMSLPNAALDLLEAEPVLPRKADRLLHAEALIDTGRAADALSVLDGVSDQAAARLRADAYLQLGALESAYASLEPLPEEDRDRNTLALLTRDGAGVSEIGLDQALAPLSAALFYTDDAAAATVPTSESDAADALLTLAKMQRQLRESSMLREALNSAETVLPTLP